LEFLINLYTPIIRSYRRLTANFYSITSNFDEVMPYYSETTHRIFDILLELSL